MCRYFLGWDELVSGIFFGANGKLKKLNVFEVTLHQVANILLRYDGFP
jgi:hypothetical protein